MKIILPVLLFTLIAFAPVYLEVKADFTNNELKLVRMRLYRALISVWACRRGRLDFYINFTHLRDWDF